MPTTTITPDSLKMEMQERWSEIRNEYGDLWLSPSDVRFSQGEYERAMHVLLLWKNEGEKGSPIRMLRSYGVMEAIIVDAISRWCDMTISPDDLAEVKTEKRADKYDAFIDWTKDKLFEQYTTEALVEVAGFSYPTVLKFLQESPNFRKVKKGIWEIRDPKADRDAEKN